MSLSKRARSADSPSGSPPEPPPKRGPNIGAVDALDEQIQVAVDTTIISPSHLDERTLFLVPLDDAVSGMMGILFMTALKRLRAISSQIETWEQFQGQADIAGALISLPPPKQELLLKHMRKTIGRDRNGVHRRWTEFLSDGTRGSSLDPDSLINIAIEN
jgi:hypothetical protein